jgi:hypothetical protein
VGDLLEDFELSEQDDDEQASDLAAALIRLYPHLSPDLRVATYVVVLAGIRRTLH